MNIDLICRQVLMSAYLYYHRNVNVLSDHENDDLVKLLVANWRDIPHRYLPLLDPNKEGSATLAASTHHCKYTRQVEGGALVWYNSTHNERLRPLGEGYVEIKDMDIFNIDDLLG